MGSACTHPERSAGAGFDLALARELAAGSLVQLNAGSLLHENGAAAERRALTMIAARRATVCASDAHRRNRPPRLSAACRRLVELGLEPAAAESLVRMQPRRLLARGIRARARSPVHAPG